MNKNRFAAALCAALLAVTPALAGNPLKNYVKSQLESENGVYPMDHLLSAFGHNGLAYLEKKIGFDIYVPQPWPTFIPASLQLQATLKSSGLPGFVRKAECCEDLDQLLRVLQSESNWTVDREGNVIYAAQLNKVPQKVRGGEAMSEEFIQYSIDLDRHTITAEFADTGTLLLKKLKKNIDGKMSAEMKEQVDTLKPLTADFEFGRCRESFIGNLEAAAATKLDAFAWQLEAGDFDAVLDELLKNAGVNHRKMDDGSERVTSDIFVDGIKCAEAIVLDRKNNTAKVTVSCAPLRVAKTVTPANLEDAKKRVAEQSIAELQQAGAALQQKADAGDLDAIKQIAEGYVVAHNKAEALNWYRKGVDLGYTQLAQEVADRLLEGNGFEKNQDQALEWYRLAVEKGDTKCALAVAKRFRSGDGVAMNIDKALEWYSLAAEKGDADAALEVAEMFRYGRGVDKNEDTALSWYQKLVEIQSNAYKEAKRAQEEKEFSDWIDEAKKLGHSDDDAQKIAEEKRQNQLQKAQKDLESPYGRSMLTKPASAATARKIADDLMKGEGFTRNEEKAFEWYDTAYRHGDEKVADDVYLLQGLTYSYYSPIVNNKIDNAKALEWYQKWTDATPSRRQKIDRIKKVADALADSHEFMPQWGPEPKFTKKDNKAAIEWYQKAVDLGDASAAGKIGDLYRKGCKEFQPDTEKALEWYQKEVDLTEDTHFKIFHIKQVADGLSSQVSMLRFKKRDPKTAIVWYQKAADLGDEGAANRVKDLSAKLSKATNKDEKNAKQRPPAGKKQNNSKSRGKR